MAQLDPRPKVAPLALYDTFFVNKGAERVDLFSAFSFAYGAQRALYPGSFVHISPSFVIPHVTYVDTDKRCPRFFHDEGLLPLIKKRKTYSGDPDVRFFGQDYHLPLPLEDESFDLLVSQYAGPVSVACKRYLKRGGHLLANDSHADASYAHLDPEFVLVATVQLDANGRHTLDHAALDSYFEPKGKKAITKALLEETGRGPRYRAKAEAYIFERH